MILIGVVLAVLVGLVRKGRIDNLADLGIRGIAFVWGALALRFFVDILASRGVNWPWLQLVAYGLIAYTLFVNVKLPGIKLFAAGTFLNFFVIAANGGAMPVSVHAIGTAGIASLPNGGTHVLMDAGTRLWLLADIIPLRIPFFPLAQVISVGDILIVAGIFIFIQHRMQPLRSKFLQQI